MPESTDLRPANLEEQQRLSLLAEIGVLDTDPEPGFDALTRAAAALTQCPIALISLVDGDRQWFKAHVGVSERQTPRAWSFCSRAIHTPDLMEVRDAQADLRFAGNPLVVGAPFIRFYAGQPLTVDGIRIGTLCVIDTEPRVLGMDAREALRDMAAAASAMLAERRRRAVSAEQQRRLTEFAMVAGDWLWETDAEHHITWMSCAYGSQPALPEPWVLGQPMANGLVLESPDHPFTAFRTTLHELFEQRLGFARALVRSEPGGEERYLSHSAVCRRDAFGVWNGYRGITRDLTAHVAAEASHRIASALLADLSAQVPGVIFQMQRNRVGHVSFPFVSNRINDVCELDADLVMRNAKVALRRCHRHDAARVMTSIRTSASELSVWQETFRVVLPVAGERTLLIHAEPRRSEVGVLWHGLMTDITEQILATRLLQQLTLAQVAAEKAVEVRSEFMSRVSHELRTPLNAILGFAQMLRLNGPMQSGVGVLASVHQIESAGAHLLSLVNDMLDLSSLDAGRLNLFLQPVSLTPVVESCIALIAPHAQERGVTLEVRGDPDIPTVLADVRAVKQVLFNLLGNAVKFAHPDTVVHVLLQNAAPEGNISLAVSDEGPGIAPEQLDSLFEPFGRIHVGRTTPTGSGLGLSISQKLVLAMGGRIGVTSVLGRGTTFSLNLPADGRPDLTEAADSAFDDSSAPPQVAPMGQATVLYIEDERVNALLMQAIFDLLPEGGPRLIVASSGTEGLSGALRLQPDLILLDMNLLDIDGLSILQALMSDSRTANIPVIAVSADAMPEQILRAREAGCQDYWTKPINLHQVQAKLRSRFSVATS